MKKLTALMLALALALACLTGCGKKDEPDAGEKGVIVTSFFPIYLFALNLTDGIDGLSVRCLTPPAGGCLHDYQLQVSDMKALDRADIFLINGAGMEAYLSGVMETFPELKVVDASAGVHLLESCEEHDHGHDHEGEEDHHGHMHEMNAHIWLDAQNAIIMVRNLAEGLTEKYPEHAEQILKNRDDYIARLEKLDVELKNGLSDLPHEDIITFHEAFPYFAEAYGLHVAAVLNQEPEDTLSPRALANLCETVEALGDPPLFIEPQYEDAAARTVAQETGAKVYVLDPVVTGPEGEVPLDYYEEVMRRNMAVLLEALGE